MQGVTHTPVSSTYQLGFLNHSRWTNPRLPLGQISNIVSKGCELEIKVKTTLPTKISVEHSHNGSIYAVKKMLQA